MAIKHVRVKNKVTGAVTSLPESALPNMSNWQPVDGPTPKRPKPKKQIPPADSEPSVSNQEEELSHG